MALLPLLIVCAQSSSLAEVPKRAFPGSVLSRTPGVVELAMDAQALRELGEHRHLVLEGLPWLRPGELVNLALSRRSSPVSARALHVNGQRVPSAVRAGATFWSGRVAGRADSDVFLAFAGGATWGWVLQGDELVHVVTGPDANADWTRATTFLVTEEHYLAGGAKPFLCETEGGESRRAARLPRNDAQAMLEPALARGDFAIETDWQFFQIFGDLSVAEGYVLSLLAAANLRFQEQANAVLVLKYLGFYTNPADPWVSQDMPGSICFDLLYEFQAAWQFGGAPVAADLHHFLSGVDLGCGVAFLDALCDPEESFSVMSRMDGLTPFPVVQGPLNWDFIWMCHELGHNFGSVHTHQYCPPIDECSPAGYWGDCQDEMACTSSGTMMSYCHVCPGQMANFTTWFHPVVSQTMRAAVAASCFQPFVKRR